MLHLAPRMLFFMGWCGFCMLKTGKKPNWSSVRRAHLLFTQIDRSLSGWSCMFTPTTNAVFIISLCSIWFPLFFSLSFPSLFSFFALRLERTRCSQKMKLGTWCFKCCLGWFLYTSMVRSFHHIFSSVSSVVVLIWDLLHEPQLKPQHHYVCRLWCILLSRDVLGYDMYWHWSFHSSTVPSIDLYINL